LRSADQQIVGIVDYGMGNLRSVQSALELLGVQVVTSDDRDRLRACDRLILPGVGSFFLAMQNLRQRRLDQLIHEVVDAGRPLLGVCLGMQLLARLGTEDGECEGLGFFDAEVRHFETGELPVPHIGFNSVRFVEQRCDELRVDLGGDADFYFVHSYRVMCANERDVAGWCDYGGRFAAVIRRGNVFGTQFHPEKSQSNGLKLLKGFLGASC
jgi:glutamine amidotransferase